MQDEEMRGARPILATSEGYQVGYFAFRHGITEEQARKLIDKVGTDRGRLDAAALRLKGQMLPDAFRSQASREPKH